MSFGAFAVNKTYDGFGAHFSTPLVFHSEKASGVQADITMPSVGFGLNAYTLYSEKVGIFATLDCFFPQAMKYKLSAGGEYVSFEVDKNEFSVFGMSLLVGPAFAICKTEKILFTISPGIHYMYEDFTFEASRARCQYSFFGIGADINCNFVLGKKFLINVGLNAIYDFFGYAKNVSDLDSVQSFMISPRVGFGIRFK